MGIFRDNPTMSVGYIDTVEGNTVSGWVYSPLTDVRPWLLVDGVPARLRAWPLERPDVAQAINIPATTGFVFELSHARRDAVAQLFTAAEESMHLVAETRLPAALDDGHMVRLEDAAAIASNPEGLAIVCADAHDPAVVRRSTAIAAELSQTRPVLLAGYVHARHESLPPAWPDLPNVRTLLVPGRLHLRAIDAIRAGGVRFGNLVLCGGEYASARLASALAEPSVRVLVDLDGRSRAPEAASWSWLRQVVASRDSTTSSSTSPVLTCSTRDLADRTGALWLPYPESNVQEADRVTVVVRGTEASDSFKAANAVHLAAWAEGRSVTVRVLDERLDDAERALLQSRGDDVITRWGDATGLRLLLEDADLVVTRFGTDGTASQREEDSAIIEAAEVCSRAVIFVGRDSDGRVPEGVEAFRPATFARKLRRALRQLPRRAAREGATLAGSPAWEAAVQGATCVQAAEIFPGYLTSTPAGPGRDDSAASLLLWKQHDAGLYGRRVDQAARALRRDDPNRRVVVLEIVQESVVDDLERRVDDFRSDAAITSSLLRMKLGGGLCDEDGIEYHTLVVDDLDHARSELSRFLVAEGLLPHQTELLLYPILWYWEAVAPLLAAYRQTIEVVDNQLSWAAGDIRRDVRAQYVAMLSHADQVIFNSQNNYEFFRAEVERLGSRDGWRVVPNWYLPPREAEPIARNGIPTAVYAGHMNVRVDWEAFSRLAGECPDIRFVLTGVADSADDGFDNLRNFPNVSYLGALPEKETWRLLRSAHVGLLPHLTDSWSTFMNPLKVLMYRAAGLPVVGTAAPGTEPGEGVHLGVANRLPSLVRHVVGQVSGEPARHTDLQPALPFLRSLWASQ